MFDEKPTLKLLFEQLGLPSEDVQITTFIAQHQLAKNVMLHQADFWTDSQRDFLTSHWQSDDNWSLVIDELSELLSQNIMKHDND
ncbi:DUF2789 family protein [Acinetobacter gerneri]|jgi:hypothetical protein|uniref:DUF2789 domain-containing protein n=2 Tax=Acinetobacter gerneri TaxID=202952 RepID=N8ZJ41_9GAMM|nr:DUF2789 family protein [Acinetobacter gerneri]ENV31525.1 hypothetical protein F960_03886 [Acinetobacter gerneri DSM 14967 = CIP 107464 = MTCC 9824]EPR81890.1 hypothetical protein L289_3388 [Acinetobacter gerneri DSM 14967 = CIP 107464 = MTCC 9824]MDQ9008360.1 DUF2789 family protein [Acinetobacter gerneri]MDQ9012675.1 DUF2789 family protein [Acinetobacter gerneri]MDQ9024110.1 DUF2789 family protein [Acinetobacter gerneri]